MVEFLWAVEVNEPPTGKRQWGLPNRYMVVAPTMEEAMKITREKHPTIEFVKILRDRNVDDVLIKPQTPTHAYEMPDTSIEAPCAICGQSPEAHEETIRVTHRNC